MVLALRLVLVVAMESDETSAGRVSSTAIGGGDGRCSQQICEAEQKPFSVSQLTEYIVLGKVYYLGKKFSLKN